MFINEALRLVAAAKLVYGVNFNFFARRLRPGVLLRPHPSTLSMASVIIN